MLATNDQQVRRLNTDLASVSDQLDGERDDLAAALKNLAVALNEVSSFVHDNRAGLTKNIDSYNPFRLQYYLYGEIWRDVVVADGCIATIEDDGRVRWTLRSTSQLTRDAARAVQQLKQVLTTLRMVPVVESVNIPFHAQFIDDEGRVHANETMEQAADAMLDELARIESALRPLREESRRAA